MAQFSVHSRPVLVSAGVFFASFAFLLPGMDRGFDFYDEGLNLVGAMRVAAGQVPHRDFYANYGPGQFYLLSWLFHWFGPSIFVERMYDLVLRSGIVTVTYAIVATRSKKPLGLVTAFLCFLWLFSAGLPTIAYPIIPVLLLVLVGSACLLPLSQHEIGAWRAVAAGCVTGLASLFRYDVGFVPGVVQVAFVLAVTGTRTHGRRGEAWRTLLFYMLGGAAVLLPVVLLYLSVAPLHPFVHDVFIYPAKYYARARNLPFPKPGWRSLEMLVVYLPLTVALLCCYVAARARKQQQSGRDLDRLGALLLFGLLAAMFYFKGFVRISIAQMLLSIVLTTMRWRCFLTIPPTGNRACIGLPGGLWRFRCLPP